MAILAIALGHFAAGRALRPLRAMTETARRISATNLHRRLSLPGPPDEVKSLADTIDDLLGRLEQSFGSQRQRAAPGVVSAEELLERVWDEHADPFTNTVLMTISRLRRKLGDPPIIETITNVGYRVRRDDPQGAVTQTR